MADLILIAAPPPWGSIALTLEELNAAHARARTVAAAVVQDEGQNQHTSDQAGAVVDAEGMSKLTGVPASWFAAAAVRGAIPSVRFGRWVRFEPAAVIAAMKDCNKEQNTVAPPVLPAGRHLRLLAKRGTGSISLTKRATSRRKQHANSPPPPEETIETPS